MKKLIKKRWCLGTAIGVGIVVAALACHMVLAVRHIFYAHPVTLAELSEITKLEFPPGSTIVGSSWEAIPTELAAKVIVPSAQLPELLASCDTRNIREVEEPAAATEQVSNMQRNILNLGSDASSWWNLHHNEYLWVGASSRSPEYLVPICVAIAKVNDDSVALYIRLWS